MAAANPQFARKIPFLPPESPAHRKPVRVSTPFPKKISGKMPGKAPEISYTPWRQDGQSGKSVAEATIMATFGKAASIRCTGRRPGPIRKRAGLATRRGADWTTDEAQAYRRRLEAWTGSLGPRNDVERYLVERAVSLSWQIDRADRPRLSAMAAEARTSGEAGPPAEVAKDSPSSERTVRYQLACGRVLLRTLDALTRMRDAGEPARAWNSNPGEPQASPSPRRRVGGYPVPMDPAPTVTCADRIPVRLRRARAAAAALAD